jgi:UDP-N-acetylglucosamine 4-epimerase
LNNKIENKKVLVTGGAGFIGSNLCDDLIQNRNEVVCLDNFSTGYENNVKHLMRNKNFRLITGDIRDIETCRIACTDIDIVLHHAALGSVPRSLKDPLTTNEVNISGFLNMLNACVDAGVRRFVYAASSSTYGDSIELPKTEHVIGMPLSPYAVTKYVNELYAHVFRLNYGLETIGLRYFNVFGRRQSIDGAYAAVIPKFIHQLIRLDSPIVNGDGNNSRDFTFIDNVIYMNNLAGITNNSMAIGQVFNTAVGDRTTLLELTKLLKYFLSNYDSEISEVPIQFGPERAGDIRHSLASIEKAKQLLGYHPLIDFKSGLEKTVDWYWNNLNKQN